MAISGCSNVRERTSAAYCPILAICTQLTLHGATINIGKSSTVVRVIIADPGNNGTGRYDVMMNRRNVTVDFWDAGVRKFMVNAWGSGAGVRNGVANVAGLWIRVYGELGLETGGWH